MRKTVEYSPSEAFVIEVTDRQDKYLYLFFLYDNEQPNWWVTSKIDRIKLMEQRAYFTTKNTHYKLNTSTFTYEKLSTSQFMYCKLGHTPAEVKALMSKKNIKKSLSNNRLSGLKENKR
jgi:hypothetical protein